MSEFQRCRKKPVRLMRVRSVAWWGMATVLAWAICVALAGASLAVAPDEILKDTALEARARTLSRELRCLVCQNQSIDDSDAPLARDLRLLLRERLVQGDSDAAAIAYIVERYGSFVLLKPPVQVNTLILWLAPLLLLAAMILGFWRHLSRSRAAATSAAASQGLTPEEAKTLEKLLER